VPQQTAPPRAPECGKPVIGPDNTTLQGCPPKTNLNRIYGLFQQRSKHDISIVKPSQLMLYREISTIFS
jgi:hypothetical protein